MRRVQPFCLRCAAGLLLIAAACARDDEPPASPRTLRVALPGPTLSLTPRTGDRITDAVPVHMVFETLTVLDSVGRPQPALAARWQSRDASTWTFVLRAGARFHDGTPVTAGHVVRAWTAAMHMPGGVDALPMGLRLVRGVETALTGGAAIASGLRAADDSTFVVELTRPYERFPALASDVMLSVPADTAGRAQRVGSGPWRWLDGEPGAPTLRFVRAALPSTGIDTVEVLASTLHSDSLVALLDRGVDCAPLLVTPPKAISLVRRDLDITFGSATLRRRILLNFDVPALRDLRVRRALQLALDLPALARASGAPSASFTTSVVPPMFRPPTLREAPVHDARAAEALLAQAGYTRARPLTLHAPAWWTGPDGASLQALAAYWTAIGVRMVYDRAGAIAAPTGQGTPDVEVYREGSFTPQASGYLLSVSRLDPYGLRLPMRRWQDAAFDSLLQVALDGRDSVQADRAIDAMVALARDSLPTIVLWYTPPMSVARRGIRACGTHLGTRPFTVTMRVSANGP